MLPEWAVVRDATFASVPNRDDLCRNESQQIIKRAAQRPSLVETQVYVHSDALRPPPLVPRVLHERLT
jgi:hypothetical protein